MTNDANQDAVTKARNCIQQTPLIREGDVQLYRSADDNTHIYVKQAELLSTDAITIDTRIDGKIETLGLFAEDRIKASPDVKAVTDTSASWHGHNPGVAQQISAAARLAINCGDFDPAAKLINDMVQTTRSKKAAGK